MAGNGETKIFGIGLSRTGTTSLTAALRCLGYRSIHFPEDETTRKEIMDFLSLGRGPLRLSILNDIDAITDTPACCVYQSLHESYAGSKFILTVRDRKSWLESCRARWYQHPIARTAVPEETPITQYIRSIRMHLYGTTGFDESLFALNYDRYVGTVLEYFSGDPQNLLVMDVCGGDSWNLICPFLGLVEPGVPFPHENRRAASTISRSNAR